MNISKKLIYLFATVLTAVLSVGCSQSESSDPDNPGFEQGIPTEVTFSLSSRAGNATRTDGSPKDPNAAVEFIYDWWIAMVDSKGNVKVLKRDDVEDKVNLITGNSTAPGAGGFEVETFKTVMPSGTYDIYAFANIGYSADLKAVVDRLATMRKNATSKEAAKTAIEEAMDAISLNSAFKVGYSFMDDNMRWPVDSNIPMTGYLLGVDIRNTIEEIFSIEVIRAVAKVEFSFNNPSADVIALDQLEFSPVTTATNLSLFPDYTVIGQKKNDALSGLSTSSLTFSNLSTLVKKDENESSPSLGRFTFYCKETLPEDGGFDIKLNVTRGGKNEEYTYKTKDITYINRNDWILIPIKFNDWIVEWKLHFYPPIGGYPPVFSQSGSGDNITATVTTGGEFELYPYRIKRNGEATDYFNSVDWTIRNTTQDSTEEQQEGIYVNVLSGSNDIFVEGKEPRVIENPNQNDAPDYNHSLKAFPKLIIGEIDPKKPGTAKVQIKFYLVDSANVDTEFICTFTINYEIPTGS